MTTLFATSSNIPEPTCAERPGSGVVFHGKYFLSSALLVAFEKHTRNTLKDTNVPTVPAIRTGQDHLFFAGIRLGPEPDGWKTRKSDNMIWNNAVIIAARLLQSTMSMPLFSPNPNYNLKSEYRKEINLKSCRMRIIPNKNLLIN